MPDTHSFLSDLKKHNRIELSEAQKRHFSVSYALY